eukprot:TRINITY_DN5465_c0_g1_i4.p1 TRINITY_DN5465_c0_g1~~TRINITY_DN5465_c0_g1_i4.p1  ORF type:complete len:329 (+),score=121.18 TRINITY_DN5465_c0_g1_i4:27-989(+)
MSGNQLKSAKALDHETKSSYSVTLSCSDGSLSDSLSTSITISDINEAPTGIAITSKAINENSTIGTAVGTISCSDEDGDTLTYSVTDASGTFTVSGDQLKSAKALNHESVASYSVTITCSDGTLSDSKAITVTVTDINEAPSGIGLSNSSINENSSIGTVVGLLSCSDVDDGDTLTYTLSDVTNSFYISTNELKVAKALDYEVKNSYSINLTCSDGSLSDTFSSPITITVNDVNEAPDDIAIDNLTINENSTVDTVVGTISCSDVDDGDNLTFSVTDASNTFTVSGNQLKLATATLNYEVKTSYSVVLMQVVLLQCPGIN